jgi:hypothetical protein
MADRFALKKLTASDLTFFEWQFRNKNAGNQKAINLNADVFIKKHFPSLNEKSRRGDGKFTLDLTILGPGLAGKYNLQRKIIKTSSYKNWRLDGEFVFNPDDHEDRFNNLVPDDLAIFQFIGFPIPIAATMVLLASNDEYDKAMHASFAMHLGGHSMATIDRLTINEIVNKCKPIDGHPIHEILFEEELEDASYGGYDGLEKILKRRRIPVSPDDLKRAKEESATVGRDGEFYINLYFDTLQREGRIESYEWSSDLNAVSPYDFNYTEQGQRILVEVKSTKGEFNRKLHISKHEVQQALVSDERYDIYRVYEMSEKIIKLRISKNFREFANKISIALKGLPKGVDIDSFSIDPGVLPFESEKVISIEDGS